MKISLNESNLIKNIDILVEEQRMECFWFNRSDWYPTNNKERNRALTTIKHHSSVVIFKKAANLQSQLSKLID